MRFSGETTGEMTIRLVYKTKDEKPWIDGSTRRLTCTYEKKVPYKHIKRRKDAIQMLLSPDMENGGPNFPKIFSRQSPWWGIALGNLTQVSWHREVTDAMVYSYLKEMVYEDSDVQVDDRLLHRHTDLEGETVDGVEIESVCDPLMSRAGLLVPVCLKDGSYRLMFYRRKEGFKEFPYCDLSTHGARAQEIINSANWVSPLIVWPHSHGAKVLIETTTTGREGAGHLVTLWFHDGDDFSREAIWIDRMIPEARESASR